MLENQLPARKVRLKNFQLTVRKTC